MNINKWKVAERQKVAKEVRKKYKTGKYSCRTLAGEYHFSQTYIYNMLRGYQKDLVWLNSMKLVNLVKEIKKLK